MNGAGGFLLILKPGGQVLDKELISQAATCPAFPGASVRCVLFPSAGLAQSHGDGPLHKGAYSSVDKE